MDKIVRRETAALNSCLLGGSAKRLYPPSSFDGPPLAILDANNDLVSSPEGVKEAAVNFYEQLYRRTDHGPMEKPWVSTPSIKAIRRRTSQDPFAWPQQMTVENCRAMLRKGNPRPHPGACRQWEKWMLKSLSDNALETVSELWNYSIRTSRFPNCILLNLLSMIHKRGNVADLANYRGICTGNINQNMPFAWLTSLLTSYLNRLQVVPPTQIATQPGVQARDLVSFIAQLECWADRQQLPLYILRRDQKKGFDRLEPEGFYDAIAAFGLPAEIAAFDRAAQTNVPYKIKTAYGYSRQFMVSGVTKQGGSLSPLKCTLTSAMLSQWLDDSTSLVGDGLIIRSLQSNLSHPHVPSDNIRLPVGLVEAMDDSGIAAGSRTTLDRLCHMSERFQASYGGETNWEKSVLFARNVEVEDRILLTSVDPINPSTPVQRWIDVRKTNMEFLRVEVNNPNRQYNEIRALVEAFEFPRPRRRLPLTALRKLVS